MDEVIIKGTKYISSKRAAKTTGYAKDYVGQLVRLGKLKAIKVGRAWFIEERAVQNIMVATSDKPEIGNQFTPSANGHSGIARLSSSPVTANVSFPATWSQISYLDDESPLYANSDSQDNYVYEPETALINSSRQETPESEDLVPKRMGEPVTLRRISHKTSSTQSVDGVRVTIHEVDQRNSARSTPEPEILMIGVTNSNRRAGRYSTSLLGQIGRILVSATIVAVVGLLIPLFG